MKENHFFVIIAGKDNRNYRHFDKASADNEAARLAQENPTEMFFILRAERVAMVAKPVPPVVFEETEDDPIPF